MPTWYTRWTIAFSYNCSTDSASSAYGILAESYHGRLETGEVVGAGELSEPPELSQFPVGLYFHGKNRRKHNGYSDHSRAVFHVMLLGLQGALKPSLSHVTNCCQTPASARPPVPPAPASCP